MDTRTKIVDTVPVADFDVIEGHFDPLLGAQAAQISRAKNSRPLVVVVREPDAPLLPSRARAELVAELRAVDYVVIGGPLTGRTIQEDRDGFMKIIRAKHAQ